MFKATRAFFSFTEVADPRRHRDYNVWHMLDHRPENFALPGIVYGERWVSTPACIKGRAVSDPTIHNFQYMNMYWMAEPMDRTFRDFIDLGERTRQMGRRPEMPYTRRLFTGIFMAVKGYVNPRVLVSPEALPFRPTRGIFLTMSDLLAPDSKDAHDMLEWYDQVHIPDLLQCKGVAGAWTFTSDPSYSSPASPTPNPAGRRIHLYYLDEDPLACLADIAAHAPRWRAAGHARDNSKTKKDLFVGPLQTIIPWQWDWFEGEK